MVTRTVPTDFPTIAAAAAASQPGDVINVLAGYSSPETTDILVNDLTINVAQAAFGQIVLTLAGTSTSLTATGAGNITLIGNAADNVLIGNEGFNLFRGGLGNDYLIGNGPAGNALGVSINDYADYRNASGAVQVTLTDSAGPDGPTGGFSTGADGNDTLENIENVIGSAFNDTLTGNSLANSLRGGGGDDTIDGGAGFDFALYNLASSGVTVTLTDRVNGVTGGTSSGADGNDTLRNIESIIGSQFDDVLTGNSENNGFNAGRGNDTLNGGAGIDTAFYSDATGSVTATLRDDGAGFSSGADGNDTLVNIENLFGGEFNDTLTGNRLANSFLGRGGDDKIDGGGGFDTVNYFGPRSNYTITKVSPGTYTVTDKTGRDGTDTLTNVERLLFGLSDSVSWRGGQRARFRRTSRPLRRLLQRPSPVM